MDGERSLPLAPEGPGGDAGTPRAPRLLLALGLATLVFSLGSYFFKAPALRRGITVGDLLEAAGAFVVLLLYGAVARATEAAAPADARPAGRGGRSAWPGALLSLAAITYALGTGIHLAANSIHDMLDATALGDPWRLAEFWDEGAGHALVDLSRIAFAIALTAIAAREEAGPRGGPAPARPRLGRNGAAAIATGAAAYGFLYFTAAVEGRTVPVALPFCALYAAWSAGWRSPARDAPAAAFFRIAAWVSLLFLAIWGVWHRGFPEFSRVGIGF